MNAKGRKSKIDKMEEPSVSYDVSKTKQKGIDPATFDFDVEMEKGYTTEEAKAESLRRIRAWWGK